ncbi:MAG: phosphoenolpyruvate--protein phosphotransferase [Pyrinomonadaceae bacterium]
MKPLSKINGDDLAKRQSSPEIRLRARAVSRGVAIGRVVCLYGASRQFYRIDLDGGKIDGELKRLRSAINTARRQLSAIAGRKSGRTGGSGQDIFESHLALIDDPSLQSRIEKEISDQNVNAEWAIKLVTDDYVAKYKAIEDEHLRDRYIDVEDVSDRILAALGAGPETTLPFAKDSVIVAKELKPSTLVELAGNEPLAFVTENGGWTSHSFILAREMNRPAVTGVKKALRRMKTGDTVIVDGYNGQVILNPTSETVDRFSASSQALNDDPADSAAALRPIKTLDGKEIRIFANSDTPAAYQKAKKLGAVGVGLYRSEFLFNRFRGFPSENEQVEAYRKIAESAREGGVRIRTFDVGVDHLQDHNVAREKNPALGLRAIRLGLGYKKLLRTQVRALLRASHGNWIDIIVPMVSGVSELRAVRGMIAQETENLRTKGTETGSVNLGAMIEVPSAVLMVDEILEETEFLCLGTNDLIQYLLAADRDNESVSDWYRTLHPGVVRAVRTVLRAAAKAGKPVIICGEMAGSPYYVPLLIGLGATDLSMNATSIKKIRHIISGIAVEEAERMVKRVETARTVEEIESEIDKQIRKNWLHLFPKDFSFSQA